MNAKIRCPSADTVKGLVVRTENGSLLVTGKVWQSAVKSKMKIEVDGEPIEAQPIVPEISTHRVTDKSHVKALLYPQYPVPVSPIPAEKSVEQLAAIYMRVNCFSVSTRLCLWQSCPQVCLSPSDLQKRSEGIPLYRKLGP